jgi:hypothetical protein
LRTPAARSPKQAQPRASPPRHPSLPVHFAAQSRRCRPIAARVLRSSGALAVRVTEVPPLPRQDESAHELPVDPLPALALRSASATDHPGCDDWGCASPSASMFRGRVLRASIVDGSLAAQAAEALIGRSRHELLPAERTVPRSPRNHPRRPRSSACLAGAAERLVAVVRVEATPAPRAVLDRGQSGSLRFSAMDRGELLSIGQHRGGIFS